MAKTIKRLENQPEKKAGINIILMILVWDPEAQKKRHCAIFQIKDFAAYGMLKKSKFWLSDNSLAMHEFKFGSILKKNIPQFRQFIS